MSTASTRMNGVLFPYGAGAATAFNVRDPQYGAKGDGVTDDTAAVNAAITAALAAGGGVIYFPQSSAAYRGNWTLAAKSSIAFVGGGARRSVSIQPFTNAPVFTLDSTSGSMQGISIDNLSFTAGTSTSAALSITGTNINDWHSFKRLFFTGFTNAISITGRTIWSRFVDVEVVSDLGRGFFINTSSAVNDLLMESVRVGNSASDGIYLNCTSGVQPFLDIILHGCNSENNGGHGIVVNNIDGFKIAGCYVENNGVTDSGILIGGTWARAHSISSSIVQGQAHGYNNSATLTSGAVTGNYFNNTTDNIAIATTHADSHIAIGANYDPIGPAITIDINGKSHVSGINPLAIEYNSESTNTPSALNKNLMEFTQAGALTVANVTGAFVGQLLEIRQSGTGTVTLSHAAGGAGQFNMPNSAAMLLTTGYSAMFQYNGSAWEPANSMCSAAGNYRFTTNTVGLAASAQMTIGDANTTGVNVAPSGTSRWQFNSTQLTPFSDKQQSLGTASLRPTTVYGYQFITTPQVIAAASSITVSPSNGDKVRINLSGTAITSMTISAGSDGEEMVVLVAQDATGGRSIPSTWTNVAFPGGSYTRSAGANAIDVITLCYDGTLSKWVATVSLNVS